VAEGAGLLGEPPDRVVLAGHGFGGIVAAWAARRLADRCAGVVLVDGGWESADAASGVDVEEFLRTLDEPPEVMRSLGSFLEDRAGFDPATWDADQERAARATVVETHAGRVVPSTRPHAREACVRAMFEYDPIQALAAVKAPLVAFLAGEDVEVRLRAAQAASAARRALGLTEMTTLRYDHVGHNLMRYRPQAVTDAIASLAFTAPPPTRAAG
jgi:pimeloyl-ACP methyl ester carboxylesterase